MRIYKLQTDDKPNESFYWIHKSMSTFEEYSYCTEGSTLLYFLLLVRVLFSQRGGIYLESPSGAADSPCQSALLFFSSISTAAATAPVGRVAGQWQGPLTGDTDVFGETEDSGRESEDVPKSRPFVSAWLINDKIGVNCHGQDSLT